MCHLGSGVLAWRDHGRLCRRARRPIQSGTGVAGSRSSTATITVESGVAAGTYPMTTSFNVIFRTAQTSRPRERSLEASVQAVRKSDATARLCYRWRRHIYLVFSASNSRTPFSGVATKTVRNWIAQRGGQLGRTAGPAPAACRDILRADLLDVPDRCPTAACSLCPRLENRPGSFA